MACQLRVYRFQFTVLIKTHICSSSRPRIATNVFLDRYQNNHLAGETCEVHAWLRVKVETEIVTLRKLLQTWIQNWLRKNIWKWIPNIFANIFAKTWHPVLSFVEKLPLKIHVRVYVEELEVPHFRENNYGTGKTGRKLWIFKNFLWIFGQTKFRFFAKIW